MHSHNRAGHITGQENGMSESLEFSSPFCSETSVMDWHPRHRMAPQTWTRPTTFRVGLHPSVDLLENPHRHNPNACLRLGESKASEVDNEN